jgi:hypothetical protein
MRRAVVIVGSMLCLALASTSWADKDKEKGHGRGHEAAVALAPAGRVIVPERDRGIVYTYYRTEYVGGRCPPGLAKKGNGCLPPGQANRLWAIGAPLPPALVFQPLPDALLAQLAPPPAGYLYIRLGSDILLMASGSRMVAAIVGDLADLQPPMRPLVSDRDRNVVADYYRNDYLGGACPAGLLRTDTGCEAPRPWALGEPLAPDVPYEPLPQGVLGQVEPAPDGYEYIRLGDRILLMVTATRVISADVLDLAHVAVTRVAVPPPARVVVPVEGGGGCPPGLAKKHNGCLPPGHAK